MGQAPSRTADGRLAEALPAGDLIPLVDIADAAWDPKHLPDLLKPDNPLPATDDGPYHKLVDGMPPLITTFLDMFGGAASATKQFLDAKARHSVYRRFGQRCFEGILDFFKDKFPVAIVDRSTFIWLGTSDCMSRYCSQIRTRDAGRHACQMCDYACHQNVRALGRSVLYQCHAGVHDFGVPLRPRDNPTDVIGTLIGGQFAPIVPDYKLVHHRARTLGIEPVAMLCALEELPVLCGVSRDIIESALRGFAQFLKHGSSDVELREQDINDLLTLIDCHVSYDGYEADNRVQQCLEEQKNQREAPQDHSWLILHEPLDTNGLILRSLHQRRGSRGDVDSILFLQSILRSPNEHTAREVGGLQEYAKFVAEHSWFTYKQRLGSSPEDMSLRTLLTYFYPVIYSQRRIRIRDDAHFHFGGWQVRGLACGRGTDNVQGVLEAAGLRRGGKEVETRLVEAAQTIHDALPTYASVSTNGHPPEWDSDWRRSLLALLRSIQHCHSQAQTDKYLRELKGFAPRLLKGKDHPRGGTPQLSQRLWGDIVHMRTQVPYTHLDAMRFRRMLSVLDLEDPAAIQGLSHSLLF